MKRSNIKSPSLSLLKPGVGTSSKSGLVRGRPSYARSAEDIPQAVKKATGSRDASPSGNAGETAKAGVRYITEEMIRKQAKEDNIEMITALNLTLSKEGGKKIKYIENLDRLKRLVSLNLSCNIIEKIEKIEKLTRLKELNLSYNLIVKVEGLETLINLQVLNVSGNMIEHIPAWLSRKLKALRVFRAAKNKLASLSELSKLKSLSDLTQLVVNENPLSTLPHARHYLIFHLRALESLDGQEVTDEEREEARSRFEQDEIENLERQLVTEENKYKKLEDEHNKSVNELVQRENKAQDSRRKDKDNLDKMKELERQLETKSDLLKKKTTDLTQACEKHYELEQELAFLKLDSKFNSLGPGPSKPDQDDEQSGLVGESPYIGRARYKQNTYSFEQSISASPQQSHLYSQGDMTSPMQMSHAQIHPEVRGQLEQVLDRDLEDKQKAIERTQEQLQLLQLKVDETDKKVLRATQELRRVTDLAKIPLHTDDGKQKLRQLLARKMQLVNELRDSAGQVEDEMEQAQQNLSQHQLQLSHLQGKLHGMDTGDPLYREFYREMVDQEQQVTESGSQFSNLQEKLEELLQTVARETDEIRQLELQLYQDEANENAGIREELDTVVTGLQTYLQSMQEQSKKQQSDYNKVVNEKATLEDRIAGMENQLSALDEETRSIQELRKRLVDAEVSLEEQRGINQTLHEQADANGSHQGDPYIESRLGMAEDEVKELRKLLREAQRDAESDKETLKKDLQTERNRASQASRRLQELSKEQQDVAQIQTELDSAKSLNKSLTEQLSQRAALSDDAVDPEQLRYRLRDLTQAVTERQSYIQPEGHNDIVGHAFRAVQTFMEDQLIKSGQASDESSKAKQMSDAEVDAMRDQIEGLDTHLRKEMDRGNRDRVKLEDERKLNGEEIEHLQRDVRNLRNLLKDAQNKAKQASPTRIVYAPKSDTTDNDSLNTEEKSLLDELQNELMELRNSMRNKDIDQDRKLVNAETDVSLIDDELRQKQEEFSRELNRQRREADLQRERQDARARVIADDLSQARADAEYLQQLLQDRDRQLGQQVDNSDMTNQMIGAQEEEIARLYDILDVQRNEIESLNNMLDDITDQGPDAYGPDYDSDLQRLRGNVNNLKETLAMQSQYVQTLARTKDNIATQAGIGTGGEITHAAGSDSDRNWEKRPRAARRLQLGRSDVDKQNVPPSASRSPRKRHLQSHIEPVSTFPQGTSGSAEHTDRTKRSAPRDQDALSPHPSKAGHGDSATRTNQRDPKRKQGEQATSSAFRPVEKQTHVGQTQQLHPSADDDDDQFTDRREFKTGKRPSRTPRGDNDHFTDRREFKTGLRSSRGGVRGVTSYIDRKETKSPSPDRQSLGHSSPERESTSPERQHRIQSEPLSQRYGSAYRDGYVPRARRDRMAYQPQEQGIPPGKAGYEEREDVVDNLPYSDFPSKGPVYFPNGLPISPIRQTSADRHHARQQQHHATGHGDHYPGVSGGAYQPESQSQVPMVQSSGLPRSYEKGIQTAASGQYEYGPAPPPPPPPPPPPMLPIQQPIYAPFMLVPQPQPEQQQPYHTILVPGSENAMNGSPRRTPKSGQNDRQVKLPEGFLAQGSKPMRVYEPASNESPRKMSKRNGSGNRSTTPRKYQSLPAPVGIAQVPPPQMVSTGTGGAIFVPLIPMPNAQNVQVPVSDVGVNTGQLAGLTTMTTQTQMYQPPPLVIPLSPIKSVDEVSMSRSGSPRKGILKKSLDEDDNCEEAEYLFCNVPEHHDLEDYITELKDKLRDVQAELRKERASVKLESDVEEKRLVKKLLSEMEERRSELEGLDLAIERQKKDMRILKREEHDLNVSKDVALDELSILKDKNDRRLKRRKLLEQLNSDSEDEEYDYTQVKGRQKYLNNEISCLERTLAKRKADLQEADRMLKECSTDLKEAREQARETVRKYDEASAGLEHTVRDATEIEKRATCAGVELVKAKEHLSQILAEVHDTERRKVKQDRLLKDIIQVIAKKDAEYREVDARFKQVAVSLQRTQAELSAAQHREKDVISALKESEEVLGKRRTEMARLREQIESQRSELEKVDQEMGKKRTELKLVDETLERRQAELSSVLREAEAEITSKQRELKEKREACKDYESQMSDLTSVLKVKRAELQQIKSDMDMEDEVLQKVIGSVNKQKMELKHTYEIQQIEQNELDSLKTQHAQKLAELEKTQKSLLEEKAELDQLTAELNRKVGELDRLKQTVDRERHEVDRLDNEKQTLEDRVNNLSREREALDENYKVLESKVTQMKRAYKILEEKLDQNSRRYEKLDVELRQKEKDVDGMTQQRSSMQKDAQIIKQTLADGREELKDLKDTLRETEDQLKHSDMEFRDTRTQRDEIKLEMDRLNEAIRHSRLSYDECSVQEQRRREDLQDIVMKLEHAEVDENQAQKLLIQVKQEIEKEENKLSRIIGAANNELESLKLELGRKRDELQKVTLEVNSLVREAEQRQISEERFIEMEKRLNDLNKEVHNRSDEKSELSIALTRSYDEVQKLRSASGQERELLRSEKQHLESVVHDLEEQLQLTKQDLSQLQMRTTNQVSELETIAQEHFSRANQLNTEMNNIRQEYMTSKTQDTLQILDNLERSRNDAVTDLYRVQHEKDSIDDYLHHINTSNIDKNDDLSEDKENKGVPPHGSYGCTSPGVELLKRKALKEKLVQEQDYLRYQLQSQMSRHAEVMENARLQSQGTLDSLRQKLDNLQGVLTTKAEQPNNMRISRSPGRSSHRTPTTTRSPVGGMFSRSSVLELQSLHPSRHSYQISRPRSRSRSNSLERRRLSAYKDSLLSGV